MSTMALPFESIMPPPPEAAMTGLRQALSRLVDRKDAAPDPKFMQELATVDNEIRLLFLEASASYARFVELLERMAQIGAPLNYAVLTDILGNRLTEIESGRARIEKKFRRILKLTGLFSRARAEQIGQAMKRIYALMDGHIADLRTARQRVLEIEKKAHDAKSDRLDRSVKAYASAVTAAIPGADVSFGNITLRDDVLLIEMKVAVPADQWLDRRGLLDREMMAHEIVRRIDPDVLGMLALRFEPVRDAA